MQCSLRNLCKSRANNNNSYYLSSLAFFNLNPGHPNPSSTSSFCFNPNSSGSGSAAAFSSTSASFTYPNYSIPAKDVVHSFKQWFKTRNDLLLDRIFQILNTTRDHNDTDLSSADFALSALNLRLSEAFVLEVLRYGNNDKDVLSCLKFFDWVGRQPGFHHTRATFNAIYKILSRAKLMSLMLDFLATYRKHRYAHNVRFHDTLVMGYAVAGKPDIALLLFGKMRFQGLDLDSFAYHVLLNALVEEKCFDAVQVIAKQISLRGLDNEITHSVMLKWYCKQNLLDEAEGYLRKLGTDTLPVNVNGHMVSVLVDALCKHNKFDHARTLVEEFGHSGVLLMESVYNVWIRDLVQAGRLDGALEFLQSKKSLEGYIPDAFRYNILISRLLREERLEEVCDLLMEMKDGQISPDKVTMNAALCFFCKAGMVDIALQLYNSRSEFGLSPNSMAYNYLINTFCGDGSIDEAYRILKYSKDHGYFPGRKTFTILADALCREGKLDKMKELVIFALEHNFMPSDSTYDKFITTLCRSKRVEDGYLIHGELNRINKVAKRSTYFSLIDGFHKLKKGDIAARLVIEMQEKGYLPTRNLYKDVICCLCEMENPDKHFYNLLEMQLSCREPSCEIYNFFIYGAGHAKRSDLARQVYEMMQRSGVEPNLRSEILMLQSYLKSERISDALNFFNDLQGRREVRRRPYTAMIVGLCKAKKAGIALNLLREMREKGVVPSDDCYEFLIQVLCGNKEYDMAVNLINDLEKVGRHITSFTGNILLWHSLKTQQLYDAWVRLREVQNDMSDSSILGLLIGAFSGCIRVNQDIENLEEVIEKCFPLDVFTYNLLLIRLGYQSKMDHACALFYKMCQKGYEPNRWTYEILVHGFLKHGMTYEAKRWVEEMYRKGFNPTGRTMRLV